MIRRHIHSQSYNKNIDADDANDDVVADRQFNRRPRQPSPSPPLFRYRILNFIRMIPRHDARTLAFVVLTKLQRRPRIKFVILIVLVVTFHILLSTIIHMLSSLAWLQVTYWMGSGYDTRGGILGQWVDNVLARKYGQWQLQQQQKTKRERNIIAAFPDVLIKNSHKIEKETYSNEYLIDILSRAHADPDTTNDNHFLEDFSNQQYTDEEDDNDNDNNEDAHQNWFQFLDATNHRNTIDTEHQSSLLSSFSRMNALPLDLQAEQCRSNWLCQRCLNTGFFGCYEKCKLFCRKCYYRILKTVPNTMKNWVLFNQDTGHTPQTIPSKQRRRRRRIPRKIHQAWMVRPTTLDFPELARMVSRWRSLTGYQHYFYTQNEEIDFIQEHYPRIIVECYQKIAMRLHRREFFILLVLYKIGGIYAGVNVMLETNLDAIIMEPNITFFAARHFSTHEAPMKNCLWNGLVGAERGHPILARAIENVVRIVGTSADDENFDSATERYVAALSSSRSQHEHNRLELWKMRLPVTKKAYVVGGCALGLAFNQALQEMSPLQDIRLGRTDMGKYGLSLILLMSIRDAGATRLTDIERNLLVASTDMIGLETTRSMQQRSRSSQRSRIREKDETVE